MFLYTAFIFAILTYSVTKSEILIDNDGGYTNVVIGISTDIEKSDVESLLLQLEILLQDASDILHTATRKRTFFKEIIFVVPKRYQNSISTRKLIKDSNYFKSPDVIISENDFSVNPYTLHNAGCGQPGLRIHIPRDFLLQNSSDKAKALAREWTHYRYGIFDESGFSGDEIYPACYTIPGSDDIKISDCTNKKAVYEFRKSSKEEYDHFPTICNPTPVVGQNNHITSSLMSKMDFPKVTEFCDDESHPHNRNARTKQNALCREQSTWKIISQHDDFKIKRGGNSKNIKPSFRYMLESDISFILAIDTSSNMAVHGRMNIVLNAFSYFALYDLPKNSEAGLINMKNNNSDPLRVTIRTQADAERLIDAFPEAKVGNNICVDCAIQRTVQALKIDSTPSRGELVIVTATDIPSERMESAANVLKSSNVTLHVIYFNRKLKIPPLLETLAKISDGRFFYIAEDFTDESPVSSLTLLYEAFRSIYQSFSWMNKNHVLVDQMTFLNNTDKHSMSFISDRTMKKFQVLLTGPEFIMGPPVVKDTVVLRNSAQRYVPGHATFAYKIKIPAYMFTIENPQPGKWTLTFERKPEFKKPLVVIVRATSEEYEDMLSMESWIMTEDSSKAIAEKRPPIIFYSEIKMGNLPVTNVTVTAFIHQASSNKQTSLKLYDGGEGDPDITKNDGIFSRYFTNVFGTGYYSLTFVAEKQVPQLQLQESEPGLKQLQCCGSSISENLAYQSGSFKRIVTHKSFFVNSEKMDTNFPPRRIADLRIQYYKENYYILKWTAPGENYDFGTAADYEIRVFRNREDAVTNFDTDYLLIINEWNIHGPWLLPQEVGTLQSTIVELKNLTEGTYFIAIRATDFSGQTGDVSNIIEIKYNKPKIPIESSSKNPLTSFPDENDNISPDDNTLDKPVTLASNLGLAVGLTSGILFLLIVIGIILFIYFERNRKIKKTLDSGLKENTNKTESSDTLCRSTGAGNVSIISPVNSWPAGSLLSHYETVQKKKQFENSTPIVPQSEDTDSASIESSKYSYINKFDHNSSLYDPIYFHQVQDRDDVNYPFNPSYFNPVHTSSLRRTTDSDRFVNHYPSDNASFYSSTLDGRRPYRLKTDV